MSRGNFHGAMQQGAVEEGAIQHGSIRQDWKQDHWLARAGFGLFVAGLMVSLVALYLSGPVDF